VFPEVPAAGRIPLHVLKQTLRRYHFDMSEGFQTDWRLICGVAASALLHLGVAAALAWRASDASAADDAEQAAALPEPDEIRPGIERSRTTTITWIGYEEPTPQQAERAPIDQAAQTRSQPAAAPSQVSAEDRTFVPPPAEQQREQTAQSAAPAQSEARESAPDPIEPVPANETAPERAAQKSQEADPDSTARKKPTRAQSEQDDADASPQRTQEPPAAPRTPETDEQDPAPETSDAEPGEPSDRESPAASKEEFIERDRLGKPAAREGVYIETVRPQWTILTTLTTRPRNPLIVVHFNSRGRVAYAEIIESSGSRNVDGPLLNAIYNWTARGEKIEALRPDTEEEQGERAIMRFRIGLR